MCRVAGCESVFPGRVPLDGAMDALCATREALFATTLPVSGGREAVLAGTVPVGAANDIWMAAAESGWTMALGVAGGYK